MLKPIASFWQSRRTGQIRAAQERELERLLAPATAEKLGRHDAYCRLAQAIPRSPAGSRVLEVGCGPGKFVALLGALGHDVVGIDPYEFQEWSILRRRSGATLQHGIHAERLPFEDHCFDHAVCLGALLYFDQPQVALAEMKRVIKPGGRLILRTVNRGNLYTRRTGRRLDPASKNLYSMRELIQLIEPLGLSVLDQYAFGAWPPVAPGAWWYLTSVWLPLSVQTALSAMTPRDARINNVVVAKTPALAAQPMPGVTKSAA